MYRDDDAVNYFQITVTFVSFSISFSMVHGERPVLQHISSKLINPVYIFWRPDGTDPVNTGYLCMHRINLCCSPKMTIFRSSML